MQISQKDRIRRISFENVKGGDDLVELDFKSAIFTALRYWELGREPEKDHYKFFRHDSYVDRKHIKNLTKLCKILDMFPVDITIVSKKLVVIFLRFSSKFPISKCSKDRRFEI